MKANPRLWIATLLLCACQQEQAAVGQTNQSSIVQPAKDDVPAADQTDPRRENRSQYTSIGSTRCRLVEENVDQGGYWLEKCKGHAGWQFEWSGSDLREDIVLIAPGGEQSELRLTELVANGAFNSVGKTIEWRGADPDDPEALIVRMIVQRSSEDSWTEISRLVVIRLKAPACVVAVVEPGPGQNEQARKIADGELPDCLKPQ